MVQESTDGAETAARTCKEINTAFVGIEQEWRCIRETWDTVFASTYWSHSDRNGSRDTITECLSVLEEQFSVELSFGPQDPQAVSFASPIAQSFVAELAPAARGYCALLVDAIEFSVEQMQEVVESAARIKIREWEKSSLTERLGKHLGDLPLSERQGVVPFDENTYQFGFQTLVAYKSCFVNARTAVSLPSSFDGQPLDTFKVAEPFRQLWKGATNGFKQTSQPVPKAKEGAVHTALYDVSVFWSEMAKQQEVINTWIENIIEKNQPVSFAFVQVAEQALRRTAWATACFVYLAASDPRELEIHVEKPKLHEHFIILHQKGVLARYLPHVSDSLDQSGPGTRCSNGEAAMEVLDKAMHEASTWEWLTGLHLAGWTTPC